MITDDYDSFVYSASTAASDSDYLAQKLSSSQQLRFLTSGTPAAAAFKGFNENGMVADDSVWEEDSRKDAASFLSGTCRPLSAVQPVRYVAQLTSQATTSLRGGNGAPVVPSSAFATVITPLQSSQPAQMENEIRQLEKRVMDCVNESCLAERRGDIKLALEKAKEASSNEHALIRLLEQSAHDDSHNFELTYIVLFAVAHQYVKNEMYTEALNMYKAITKNKVFQNGMRLKLNIGNIYVRLGMYHDALKTYRWILDRIPDANQNFRMKILHNIGITCIKMRKTEDACANFEYMIEQKCTTDACFHAIICHFVLGNVKKMKKTFETFLNTAIEVTDLQNRHTNFPLDTSDIDIETFKWDQLSHFLQRKRSDADRSVIISSNLISPLIEESYSAGYNWCLDAIKNSNNYRLLSGDLEVNKAAACLRNYEDPEAALTILEIFDKRDNRISGIVFSNLSFIHFLLGKLDGAEWEASQARESNVYSAAANVNMGNTYFAQHMYDKAAEYYQLALQNDSSCIEALYNLGLTEKKRNRLDDALICLMKVDRIISSSADVLYQIAHTYELMDETDKAVQWYIQVIGIIPSATDVLQKLADIFEKEHDRQQAYYYCFEAFRYLPSKISILDWLGEYFMELRLSEKANLYFTKAALSQPMEQKWKLLMGTCYRQSGNYQFALNYYKNILKQFPNNIDCLKLLVGIGHELGLKETNEYEEKLKAVQKDTNLRIKETNIIPNRGNVEYNDPVGPLSRDRPRTTASSKFYRKIGDVKQKEDFDEDSDDNLDTDLLLPQ